MSLLWKTAVRMNPMPHDHLVRHVSRWPDKVHVTQAGFSGHVQSPVLDSFLKTNRRNQDDAWYRKEDVDLGQPIHSWQPHIVKQHLLKYLHDPHSDTEKVKRDRGHAQQQDPKSDWSGYDGYAGDDHPTIVRWQGRHIVTDGSHRVAAEMLRGTTSHVRAWVYDADKHGFPDSVYDDPPSDYPPKPKLPDLDDDWDWGDDDDDFDLHDMIKRYHKK